MIQVLGPVSVVVDGTPETLGPRLTRLLAALALDRGSVVSTDRLVDIVWAGEPPRGAEATLKSYVSRLRRALGGADAIARRPPGYVLVVDDDALDSALFDAELDLAQQHLRVGDHHRARSAVAAAIDRWNGSPFGGLGDEEWAEAECHRLEERYLEARELAVEVALADGREVEAIAEARKLASEVPLRERPRELLMRALYSSGRHAEALREYQTFSRLLADETGLDPSAELVDLEQRMLNQELSSEGGRRWLRGYELGERVGQGSFSVVHRATQPGVGREVAVKIIRSELANRPDFVRRFEREARIVATVEHPNVVPLYDFWREPGAAYIVMRYLRGGSVESALRSQGPFSADRVVRTLEQVGSGLAAAHRAGLVHRDVRPANLLLDDDGTTYLADFGIATEIAVSDDLPVLEPAYAAPEVLRGDEVGAQADILSLAVSTYELLTGRLPFADSTDRAELIRHQLSDPLPPVRSTRRDLPAAIDDVLGRATAKSAADRYQSVDDFVRDVRRALVGDAGTVALQTRPVSNPYLGLRAFTDADAGRFHGREVLVAELVGAVEAQPFVTVVGPSGCGKSSVVRAGLLPALRSGALPGSDAWFVTSLVPGDDPFASLEAALSHVAVETPTSLGDQLWQQGGLGRAIRRVLPGERLLIVVDQFEELFTSVDVESRTRFLDELADAVSASDGAVRVVATLRADHYDGPLAHPSIAEMVTRGTVTVRPMEAVELERAIVAPAGAVGVTVEPALVAELVATASAQPTALPLLQSALRELFDRRVSDVMLWSSYEAMGGLAGSLSATADRLVDAEGEEGASAARHLFGRLVAVGATEGRDRRRRATISELDDGDRTATLVETFTAARLLTTDRDVATREPTVEVAHEALLTAWPRLRAWLDDDRADLAILQSLSASAAAWDRSGRDHGDLARGARLEVADDLAARRPELLNPAERDWIEASRAAADAAAREQQRRAERDRRQNRALRRLTAAAAVLLVAALVAATIALVLRSRALDSEREAEVARAEAEANAAAAVDSEREAEAARAEAEANAAAALTARDDAEVERLVALSSAQLDVDPELAILLALEAHRRRPDATTETAVHRSLVAEPRLVDFSPVDQVTDAVEVTLSGDGRTALEWRRGRGMTEVRFRDLDTGNLRGTTTELEAISAAAISGDGAVAALLDLGGMLWIVDASGVVAQHRPELEGDPEQWSVELSGRGDVAAVVGSPPGVEIISVADGEVTATASYSGADHGFTIFDVAVSDDGSHVAVGYRFPDPGAAQPELEIEVFDATGSVVRSIGDGGSPVYALAVADDGGVYSGHRDGTVRIHPEGGDSIVLNAHDGTVDWLELTGGWLATASVDGEVRWWGADGETLVAPASFPATFTDVSVTADGRTTLAVAGGRRVTFDPRDPLLEQARRSIADSALVLPFGPPLVVGIDLDARAVSLSDLTTGDARWRYELDDVYPPGAMAPFAAPSFDGSQLYLVGGGPQRAVIGTETDERIVVDLESLSGRLTDAAGQPLVPAFFQPGGAAAPAFLWAVGPDDGSVHAARVDPATLDVVEGPTPVDRPVGPVHLLDDGRILLDSWDGASTMAVLDGDLLDAPVALDDSGGLRSLVGHDPVTGAVALGADDGRIGIFDPATSSIRTLAELPGAMSVAVFSPDGATVAVALNDLGVQLVDVATGDLLGAPMGGADVDFNFQPSVRWSADGATVWYESGGDLVELAAEPAVWIEAACRVVGRDLTADEWQRIVDPEGTPESACS